MMDRLQKKCFIGSAGVHTLLFLILLICPSLLASKQKPSIIDPQTLDFYPSKLIDAAFSGGGNPAAKPPPAREVAPPPPRAQAQPQAAAVEKPREAEVREKPARIDPDSVEPKVSPKPHRPQISTKLVTRAEQSKSKKLKTSETETREEARQQADARRRLSQQFASAAESIRESTSSATSIEDYGRGGGGPAYAEYSQYVKMLYENAWQAPNDTATDDAITQVRVTINSDGNVSSAHITRGSGDAQVDRSVQRTLDRVTFIRPFPDGAKDKQRTYIINFNLKAKRGLA